MLPLELSRTAAPSFFQGGVGGGSFTHSKSKNPHCFQLFRCGKNAMLFRFKTRKESGNALQVIDHIPKVAYAQREPDNNEAQESFRPKWHRTAKDLQA